MERRTFMKGAGGTAAGALALAAGALALAAGAVVPAGAMDLDRWRRMRRFVQTPFGRIAVVEQGSGPAAALFVHGFPLSSFQWRDAVAALSAHRRCIAPDFMALGFTEPAPGQAVDADAQVAMLAHLLDTLNVRQADVIANDSGGAVAQLMMVRHPDRVRSLLLTNCDTEPDCPPPALKPVIDLSRTGRFVDEWLLPSVLDHRLARTKTGLGGQCYAHPGSPTDEAIDAYLAPLTASPARKALVHAYALALERNILQGIGPELKRARQPVRVVWGTADDIFSAATPAYLEQAFGNGRGVRRLAGYKLFWPEERPDVVVEEALALWGVSA